MKSCLKSCNLLTTFEISFIVRYTNIDIQSKFQILISRFQLLFSFKENRKWLRNMARNFTNTSYEIRCGVSFCKKRYLNKQLSLNSNDNNQRISPFLCALNFTIHQKCFDFGIFGIFYKINAT